MSRKILHVKPRAVPRNDGDAGPAAPTARAEGLKAAIAEAAYYRAQRRGFEPGHELDDWLAAEADVASRSLLRDVQPETH